MSPLRPGGAIDNLKSLMELMKLASDILHGKQEIVVTAAGIELPPIRVKVRPVEGQGEAT